MNLTSVFTNIITKPRQVISSHWDDRKEVLERDVNLFCWDRVLPLEMEKYLDGKVSEGVHKLTTLVTLRHLAKELKGLRKEWGADNSYGEQLFWEDVAALTADFLRFSKHEMGRLTLRTIEDDACTKFHVDGYDLRLFTTYHGAGTEWLPERAVDRSALGTTNQRIVKDPSAVCQLSVGHVGILKGEIPNRRNVAKGIVHRSPGIEGSGQKRIILRIDI